MNQSANLIIRVLGLIDLSYYMYTLKKRKIKQNLVLLRDFLANPQEGRLAVDFLVYAHSSSEDLDHLRDNGFRVITRPLIPYGTNIIKDPFETQLIIDALDVCHIAKIDVVVLVSGDADYASLCYALRRRGIIVEVANFVKIPGKLRQSASKFIDLNKWIYTFDTQTSEFPKTDQSLSVLANKPLTIIHAGSTIRKSPAIDHNKPIKINSITNIYDSFSEVSSYKKLIFNNKKVIIPSFSFYNNGDYWSIGEVGHEISVKHLNGLSYIHFLLRYPGKDHSVEMVYNLATADQTDVSSKRPDPEENYAGETPYEIVGNYSKAKIIALIKHLKEKRENIIEDGIYKDNNVESLKSVDEQTPQIKKLEQEYEIKEIDKQLVLLKGYISSKKRIFHTKSEKSAQTTVYKRIKEAIEKINTVVIGKDEFGKDIPILDKYLKLKETIITGYAISYKPKRENPIEWILDPPKSPAK
jgi:hypothetical protein